MTARPVSVTLQDAYDLSTSPEIAIDVTRDPLTVRAERDTSGQPLKLEAKPLTSTTNPFTGIEFFVPIDTGSLNTFNSARIKSGFDSGAGFDKGFCTISVGSGVGTYADVLTVRNSRVGINNGISHPNGVLAVRDWLSPVASIFLVENTAGTLVFGVDATSVRGSDASLGELTLKGTSNANLGFINMDSPIIFGPYTANPNASYGFSYNPTDNPSGTFVGGGLNFSGTITSAASTFIYESFRGAPTITTGAAPGFAAYTVLQALPAFYSGSVAGQNPIPPLIINAGATIYNTFSGTRTVSSVAGINFACSLRATVNGAVMNCTSWTGMTVAPGWDTATGSTINFGTIRGVWCRTPAQALFSSSNGSENMTAYYGLDVENIILNPGVAERAAVRSAINTGTNHYFLLNTGTADSEMGASSIHFDDDEGIRLGSVGVLGDAALSWSGANNALYMSFISTADSLAFSSPAADRFVVGSNDNGNQIAFDFEKYAFGQSGVVGNQVGLFVAPSRASEVDGGWADFLMTSSGNLTVDHAMSEVYGWSVNAPSIVLGTGSVTTAATLAVGGNVAEGTNRYGLLITSNPSGGTLNYALRVTAGAARFDGRVDINNGIALGGGAVPTLGTIGGAGPTAAAQAQWIEVDVGGVAHWIPAWV